MTTAGVSVMIVLAAAGVAQDLDNIHIDRVATGFIYVEGPAWSRDGYLVVSDIPNNEIWRWQPGQKRELMRPNSNGANGNAFDAQGRLYTCEAHARRVVRTEKNGRVEVIADKWQGKRLNEPNDIVVRRDGHAWFTDPAFGPANDRRELDFYGVYHIAPKGGLEVIAKPTGRPNGIALAPDGRTLYVTNSDERNVRAYDIARNGVASNERILVSGIEGVPDGIKVDEKGNLYVAAKKLYIFSPGGQPVGAVEFDETPSNCAFGGPEMDLLFVTARTTVYLVQLGVKGATP
ncbi:MAG: SMP-30/gluconolactonase/LRE family protein [Bryobacteraceae bacterium]